MRKLLLVVAGLSITGAALAQSQPLNPPQQIKTRISQLDAACRAAGGQPVARPYVFVYDFTGDRVNDYLISEGDYNCNGKPELFRKNNAAFVEIWTTNPGAAGATMMFRETVRGYRIVEGSPRVVQLIRLGAACGQGQPATAVCPQILAWDFINRRFANASAPAFPGGPAGAASQVAGAPAPKAGAPAPAPAPQVAAAPLGPPETRPQFEARCKAEWQVKFPGEQFRPGNCEGEWDKAVAAGPAADILLALGGPGQDVNTIKAKARGVAWSARPMAGTLATGRMGKWAVTLHGRGTVEEINFQWSAVGDFSPFDVANALKAKRVRAVTVACLEYGATEQNSVWAVSPPGSPPTTMTIHHRDSPTASASADYTVVWSLRGVAPTFNSVKRGPDGADDWKARCEY